MNGLEDVGDGLRCIVVAVVVPIRLARAEDDGIGMGIAGVECEVEVVGAVAAPCGLVGDGMGVG